MLADYNSMQVNTYYMKMMKTQNFEQQLQLLKKLQKIFKITKFCRRNKLLKFQMFKSYLKNLPFSQKKKALQLYFLTLNLIFGRKTIKTSKFD